MKKYLLITLAMLVGLWLLAGCSAGSSIVDPDVGAPVVKPEGGDKGSSSWFSDPTPSDPLPWRWNLIFDYGDPLPGENYNWGVAELVEDADGNWFMKYTLFPDYLDMGWMFLDTHVHIWMAGDEVPKGNPGKFDYKWDWEGDPAEMQSMVMLPLGDWSPPADDFYLAIHCSIGIWGIVGYDPLTGEAIYGLVDDETGWGGYWDKYGDGDWDDYWKKWGGWVDTGSEKGWFPIFDPVLDKCYQAYHYGPFSYWRVHFGTEDWYPFPGSNDWVGWCTDPRQMSPGSTYCVDVYSSYDSGLPTYAQSDNWEFISYLINQRNMGQGLYNQNWGSNYIKDQFQNAVWYFKYGTQNFGMPGGLGGQFVADAIANGDNYVPVAGEWYAVILWPLGSFQMNIIEVDP